MARSINIKILILYLTPCLLKAGPVKDFESPKALEAYHSFWKTFEQRQNNLLNDAQRKYQADWQSLGDQQEKQEQIFTEKMKEELLNSASGYRSQLDEFPDADNRPGVLINLSQVLFLLYEQFDKDQDYLTESLRYLDQVLEKFSEHQRIDLVFYLKAQILTKLNRMNESLIVWKKLAHSRISSVYHVYAHMAIGDQYFYKQNAIEAANHYKKALKDLSHQSIAAKREYGLSLRYRLAWASYRGGRLKEVVEICLELMGPENISSDFKNQKRMIDDAVNLAGDALFELSEVMEITQYLTPATFSSRSSQVGLRTVRRFYSHEDHHKVIFLTRFLIEQYPGSDALPFLLDFQGMSYEKLGKVPEGISANEQLAMLLPKDSLWRSAFKKNSELIANMETLSFRATEKVAFWHMNTGVSSRLPRHFLSGASFFDILIEFNEGHANVGIWRLNKAHCYYMSENYEEADMQYSAIVSEARSSESHLKTAAWQLILTREILWRSEFQKIPEGQVPDSDQASPVRMSLSRLDRAVDQFNNRFPDDSSGTEALLISGSAHSDMQNFDQSVVYWNKVLTSQSTIAQRSVALRGIVFSHLQGKTPGETIVVVRRFLRLEDWKKLGDQLRKEFLGILAQSVIDEGKRLADGGSQESAGQLLTKIGREFKDINSRDLLLRDGAYFLAISGNWNQAREEAQFFLKENLREYRGDMVYLLARSFEFQLKFLAAAQTYFDLAKTYPKHKKAVQSAKRSEKLAAAEENYMLAAKASGLLSELNKNSREQSAYLKKAAEYALKSDRVDHASRYVKRYLRLAKDLGDQFKAKLLFARIMFLENRHQNGLNLLRQLAVTIQAKKSLIGQEAAASLLGEVGLLQGDEFRKSFDGISLWKPGDKNGVRFKSKMVQYKKLKAAYMSAINSGDLDRTGEARYKLGDASEVLAVELSSYLVNETVSNKTIIEGEIRQLRQLALKLFGQNVMLLDKNRERIFENIWYVKSRWRHGQQSPGQKDLPLGLSYGLKSPYALHLDLPFSWRL